MPVPPTEFPPDLRFPKIRPVEAIPLNDGQQQGFCLRDTRQIAANILVLPPVVFWLVSLFDGQHSLNDIQRQFLAQTGQRIPLQKIEEIVLQLDQECFLESKTYQEALKKIEQDYHDAPFRNAAFAGLSYPGDPTALRDQLDGYMRDIANEPAQDSLPHDGELAMLIAPHIDLNRGGRCFAHAYRELIRNPPADLYIILGTGHQCVDHFFALTRKSYNTPLGMLRTDEAFIERFSRRVPVNLFAEELLHRDEHSIEFQVLWLRHLLPPDWDGAIVPILCGSFHPLLQAGISPRDESNLACTLDALQETIQEHPGRVTVIAGVDFSHVGKRFGHEEGIHPQELERVQREDGDVIETLRNASAEAFYSRIAQTNDYNNLCGFSAIYMALDITQPRSGHLLHYNRALEPETESVVTFASLSYYR